MQINCTDATVQGLIIFALIRSEKLSGIHLQVQATTAIVEKRSRLFIPLQRSFAVIKRLKLRHTAQKFAVPIT